MEYHWTADFTENWKSADRALTAVEVGASIRDAHQFATETVEPLREKGFIPKGCALATRLERLEVKVAQRSDLSSKLIFASAEDLPRLTTEWQAADQSLAIDVKTASTYAAQSRAELLTESLGTPKTTYELTVRHAAAARYIKSIEGQPNAVFSATQFQRILAEVKLEAGPEGAVSLRWHQALIKNYTDDRTFIAAMNHSEPMKQAWAAYRSKYGL